MSVIWGVPYLMIKVAVEGDISVPFLVFSRLAVGTLVLLPIALQRGRFAELVRKHWKPIGMFAALEMIVPWWLLSDAERDISSGMAGLLIAVTPIVALIVAKLAGDPEPFNLGRVGGLALSLCGVFLLVLPELRGGSAWAIVEMAIVAVLYAVAPRIISGPLASVPSLSVTAACLALGTIVYAVPAWLTRPTSVPESPVLWSVIGLGLICTSLAFVVFFALIREVGPSRALVFTYINPAVAVAAGVLLLDEELTTLIISAFVLILAGLLLANRRQVEMP